MFQFRLGIKRNIKINYRKEKRKKTLNHCFWGGEGTVNYSRILPFWRVSLNQPLGKARDDGN
jgi:hypothetical protein